MAERSLAPHTFLTSGRE